MQDQYNVLKREEERDMIPMCLDRGVGLTPYSPLAKGRAARPWGQQTARSSSDNVAKAFDRDVDEPVVNAIQQVAEARGVAMAQVALAWVLSKQVVSCPIVGATSRITCKTPSPPSNSTSPMARSPSWRRLTCRRTTTGGDHRPLTPTSSPRPVANSPTPAGAHRQVGPKVSDIDQAKEPCPGPRSHVHVVPDYTNRARQQMSVSEGRSDGMR
jgi:hypothetical protein